MLFYITIISWIIIDLYSKYLAKVFLQNKINILWDFIYLQYFENTWIAFSIQLPSLILKIWTIILIFLIFYYYFKEEKKIKNKIIDFSFWLILAWAIWNWIERIFNNKVIDFLGVKYFSVFNFADTIISVWTFLYLLNYILSHKKKLWV